jgi:hypothetical protein
MLEPHLILDIQHLGCFIDECPIAGETRADGVFPAHPNGCRLNHNRFLIVYATRGLDATDDDRSIVAQVRADSYDGPVLREILLARSIPDWDPLAAGSTIRRQFGHPIVFGVPRGAIIDGRPATSENVFVIKWRITAFSPHRKPLPSDLGFWRQHVQWTQVRLNAAGDDLEIIEPTTLMRQVGYESGPSYCRHENAGHLNQGFVQPVALDQGATQWAEPCSFEAGVGVCVYRFDQTLGVYRWTDVGPLMGSEVPTEFEASLLPYGQDWLLASRLVSDPRNRIAWRRLADPLHDAPPATYPEDRANNAPITAYACPDGVVRTLGGDPSVSPYRNGRDPLYLWDIDPDKGFLSCNRRVVFDCAASGIGISLKHVPRIDMAKLLPHTGGRQQWIVHRVRSKATNAPSPTGVAITPEEFRASGIYAAKVTYDQPYADPWNVPTQTSDRLAS